MLESRDTGFIKLKRNILDWEWYQDENTFRVMIHLLLKSNYTVKQWQGITVNPGELITSIRNLGKELNLSENEIRTCIKKLKKTNYISTLATNKFTKIKITHSIIYDEIIFSNNQPNHNTKTTKPHSNNEQITTTKKVKKEEEEEEEEKESIELFKNQIFKFSNAYSQEHLDGFYNYWNTLNKQTGRRRFEDKKYWNTEDQLKAWKVLNQKNELTQLKNKELIEQGSNKNIAISETSNEHALVCSINNLKIEEEEEEEAKTKNIENNIPPELPNVIVFFKDNNKTQIDAEKFYNHFQSNGWLVGGKSPMKDWKAAARNWMLNANKFISKQNIPQSNHLHTSNNKNYGEPL